ncbi:MAG: 50S ribosomal protein L4 [Verrucomicrobia bacterium]|nr:MAG: 50S ribosomal protein L4 [Verrucomicrobiota bacterium]
MFADLAWRWCRLWTEAARLFKKGFEIRLKKQTDARKVLLVSDAFDQNTLKSGRNVKPVTLATASDVNIEQLLAFEKILVTQKALERLAERTRPAGDSEHAK